MNVHLAHPAPDAGSRAAYQRSRVRRGMWLSMLVLLFSASAHAAENDESLRPDFHPAASESETALEYILNQAAKHFNIGSNYDYTNTSLTDNLLNAIKQAQVETAKHNCNGTESLGTNCGLKYNPVTCNADIPMIYYFRTEKAKEYSAFIYTSKEPDGQNPNKYSLVYTDHEWKIDGVRCGEHDTYNFD